MEEKRKSEKPDARSQIVLVATGRIDGKTEGSSDSGTKEWRDGETEGLSGRRTERQRDEVAERRRDKRKSRSSVIWSPVPRKYFRIIL